MADETCNHMWTDDDGCGHFCDGPREIEHYCKQHAQFHPIALLRLIGELEADARLVTVCASCQTAACWHGEFLCDSAQGAGTVDLPVGALRILALEHPGYWKADV